MTTTTEALRARLLAHAELHDGFLSQDSEQAQWAADLREVARLLTAPPAEVLRQAREALAYYATAGKAGELCSGDIATDALAAIDALPSAPAADIDEAQLARLSERGAVAWAGVTDDDIRALRDGSTPSGEPAAKPCEWTNCPTRVGDVCCNDRAPTAPAPLPADWLLRSQVSDLLHLLEFSALRTSTGSDDAQARKVMADLRRTLAAPLLSNGLTLSETAATASVAGLASTAAAAPEPSKAQAAEYLFIQMDDDRRAWHRWCADAAEVREAVEAAMFILPAGEELSADHAEQLDGSVEELMDSGALTFEGDPPLYLYRMALAAWTKAPAAHPAPAVAATVQALTPDALLDMAECMRPLLQTPEDWAVALAYGKDVMNCSAAAWGVTLATPAPKEPRHD